MPLNIHKWIPILLMVVIMFMAQLIGPELLRYEATLYNSNQWWRFLTGHWVHANWMHFLLNMAGLILCIALTDVRWTVAEWMSKSIYLALCISLLFFIFHPEIDWYVGFSGVLFGLYIMAAVESFSHQRVISSLLITFMGIKIILEQMGSVKITSSDFIGVPVLVDAHLYGVLAGVVLIIAHTLYFKIKALIYKVDNE